MPKRPWLICKCLEICARCDAARCFARKQPTGVDCVVLLAHGAKMQLDGHGYKQQSQMDVHTLRPGAWAQFTSLVIGDFE